MADLYCITITQAKGEAGDMSGGDTGDQRASARVNAAGDTHVVGKDQQHSASAISSISRTCRQVCKSCCHVDRVRVWGKQASTRCDGISFLVYITS